MNTQQIHLARTLARHVAIFSVQGGTPPLLSESGTSPYSAGGAALSESVREDIEAIAAADMHCVPDFRSRNGYLLRFAPHDAPVVLRRLAVNDRDGTDAHGQIIAIPGDEEPWGSKPLMRALRHLHARYGRGVLHAINRDRQQVVYAIPGVGVRRRSYIDVDGAVSLGRHSALLAEFAAAQSAVRAAKRDTLTAPDIA